MHAASWGRFLGLFFSLKNKGTNVHSRRAVYYDWKAVTKNDGFLSQPRPSVFFFFFFFLPTCPRSLNFSCQFLLHRSWAAQATGNLWARNPCYVHLRWEAFYLYRLFGTASIRTTLGFVFLSSTPCFCFISACVWLFTLYEGSTLRERLGSVGRDGAAALLSLSWSVLGLRV